MSRTPSPSWCGFFLLLGLSTAHPALAQWQPNGVMVGPATEGRFEPIAMVADGSGGAIVAWGSGDVFAARIDPDGNVLWTRTVCDVTYAQSEVRAVSDGSGGIFIAWNDYRDGSDTSDIFAQHLDAAGTPLWQGNGAPICQAVNGQLHPSLAPDGSGGLIVAWWDRRSGTNNRIWTQRLNASGMPMWTLNGIEVVPSAPGFEVYPHVASDGSGGAVLCWNHIPPLGDNRAYAQRLAPDGQRLWGPSGVDLGPKASTVPTVRVVPGLAGNYIFVWEAPIGENEVLAKMLAADGTTVWATSSSDRLGLHFPHDAIPDGAGGVILATVEQVPTGYGSGGGGRVAIQRLDSTGNRLWPEDGRLVSGIGLHPIVTGDGQGGALVSFTEQLPNEIPDILLQRVNGNGWPTWQGRGVVVCDEPDIQYNPRAVAAGSKGAIVAWQDFRIPPNYSVFAQRILCDGRPPFDPEPPPWTDLVDKSAAIAGTGRSAGVAWGDYDGDDDLDLYVSSRSLDPGYPNQLLSNLGDRTFGDMTPVLLAIEGQGQGVAWGDYDNDGDLDLYVGNDREPNKLFSRAASGFEDATLAHPVLADAGAATGVSWVDYDLDGDLDLYVVKPYGQVNQLFRNEGSGTSFVAAPFGSEAILDAGHGTSAAWADYDNDGDPDLYLVNAGPNRLFKNDCGVFEDVTAVSGPIGDAGLGNAAAWGDYDNDGHLDLYVANNGQANLLYRNRGDGTFEDRTAMAGPLGDTGHGAGIAWADYDNDGFLDLYLANAGEPNRLFRNRGDGTFEDVAPLNPPLADPGQSLGAAWGDVDGDGRLDLYVANTDDGASRLFLNNTACENHWLHLRLVGTMSNRSAIGARVQVSAGGRLMTREVEGGAGFLSQNSLPVEFGLGTATSITSIQIRWPSGHVQDVTPPSQVDHLITVTEPSSGPGTVCGVVFQDSDGDGRPGPGEELEGWTVAARVDASIVTATTNPLGRYRIGSLPAPAQVPVWIVTRPGWIVTSPTSATHLLSLAAGQTIGPRNFSLVLPTVTDCIPPRTSLKSWFPFDETFGVIASETASRSSFGVWRPSFGVLEHVPGRHLNALRFSGDAGYVSVPSSSYNNFGTSDFTIAVWLRTGSTSPSTRVILDKTRRSVGPQHVGYRLSLEDHMVSFSMYNEAIGFSRSAAGTLFPVDDGGWHHVAVVVRRNASPPVSLYVDGVPEALASPTPPIANEGIGNNESLRIASAALLPGSGFAGDLDELLLFGSALSPSEVAALAASPGGLCKTALVAAEPRLKVCPRGTKSTGFKVTNRSSAPQNYRWTVSGIPGCGVAGIAQFTNGAGQISVPPSRKGAPDYYLRFLLRVPCVSGLFCYQVTLVNTESGEVATKHAIANVGNWGCRPCPTLALAATTDVTPVAHPEEETEILAIPFGRSRKVEFPIVNETDEDLMLTVVFAASGDTIEGVPIVRLEGLPPGSRTPPTSVLVPANDHVMVGVETEFTELYPLATPFVELLADPDGDTVLESFVSRSIESVDTVEALVDVVLPEPPTGSTRLVVTPNPFRSWLRVNFLLARPEEVRAEVFDVAGRLVSRLHQGRIPAGNHQLEWDGTTVTGARASAGLYWIRIRTAERIMSAKVVRIR